MEPLPDASNEDFETLVQALKSDEGVNVLETMKEQDPMYFMYLCCLLIYKLDMPTDDNSETLPLLKRSIVFAPLALRPMLSCSIETIREIYYTRVQEDKQQVILEAAYKALSCSDITVRQTASIFLGYLIHLQIGTTKAVPDILTFIQSLFDNSGLPYLQIGVCEVYKNLIVNEAVTKKHRYYRQFFQTAYANAIKIVSSDLPNTLKIEALNTIYEAIYPYPKYVATGEAFLELINVIIEPYCQQTEFDRQFHKIITNTLKRICVAYFRFLTDENVVAIIEAMNADLEKFQNVECHEDFIMFWSALSKKQIQNLPNDEETAPIMQEVAEPLVKYLINLVTTGDYTEILQTEKYILPIEALKCLGILSRSFPEIVAISSMEVYSAQLTASAESQDNARILISALCALQVVIGIDSEVTNEFVMSKLHEVFELIQCGNTNVSICAINILDTFIDCTLRHQQNDPSYQEVIPVVFQTITDILSGNNASLIERSVIVLQSFFTIFDPEFNALFLADNFEAIYNTLEAFIQHSFELADNIQVLSFELMASFIKACPQSNNASLQAVYQSFTQQFQSAISEAKPYAENIAVVLSTLIHHLGEADFYEPLFQTLIAYLTTMEIDTNILYTFAAATFNMRARTEPYIEQIFDVFNRAMETNNQENVNAAVLVIGDLYRAFESSPCASLNARSIEIANFLMQIALQKEELNNTLLIFIIEALSDILNGHVSPEQFAPVRDQFMSFFYNVSIALPQIDKSSYNSDSFSIAAGLFLCYKDVLEMHREERSLIQDKEQRAESYIFSVKEQMTNLAKIVYDYAQFDNGSKQYTVMLWCFCRMLYSFIDIMGRQANILINSRWMVGLYNNALNHHNKKDLRDYAMSFNAQFKNC